MERRSFIKILVAAILSPFLPSRSRDIPSAVPAIPDPAREEYAKRHVLYPEYDRERGSHVHDAVRYAMMDYKYYGGHQWTELKRAQRKLNMQRSLVLNRIK